MPPLSQLFSMHCFLCSPAILRKHKRSSFAIGNAAEQFFCIFRGDSNRTKPAIRRIPSNIFHKNYIFFIKRVAKAEKVWYTVNRV